MTSLCLENPKKKNTDFRGWRNPTSEAETLILGAYVPEGWKLTTSPERGD